MSIDILQILSIERDAAEAVTLPLSPCPDFWEVLPKQSTAGHRRDYQS
jgi:hypothetical protein